MDYFYFCLGLFWTVGLCVSESGEERKDISQGLWRQRPTGLLGLLSMILSAARVCRVLLECRYRNLGAMLLMRSGTEQYSLHVSL